MPFAHENGMPKPTCLPRLTQRGFSLAEMLVVLVIIGIALAMAVPRLQGVARVSSTSGVLNQLASDLNLARVQAIRDAAQVTLKISDTGKGYTVTEALRSGGTKTLTSYSVTRDYPAVTLTPLSQTVVFDSRGMTSAGTTGWTISAKHGAMTKTLTITGVGRIYRDF